MKIAHTALIIVGAAALGGYIYWAGGNAREDRIRAELAARVEKTAVETVTVRDVRYVRDTVRLRQVITRYDSARVTDTLVVTEHDTAVVYIPRAIADTAVAVCLSVIRSCESRVAARDSLLAAKDLRIHALEQLRPSRFRMWLDRALYFGAGAGTGALLRR